MREERTEDKERIMFKREKRKREKTRGKEEEDKNGLNWFDLI